MLTTNDARSVLQLEFPDGQITGPVRQGREYIFIVNQPDDDDMYMDPFYSVNVYTGVIKEYPLMDSQNFAGILQQFNEVTDG